MKICDIKTGVEHSVSDSYGARLIEQGQAVAVPAKKEPEKPEKAQGKPAKV